MKANVRSMWSPLTCDVGAKGELGERERDRQGGKGVMASGRDRAANETAAAGFL